MKLRMKRSDVELLRDVADFRVLTTTQIAHLFFGRLNSTRRRLAQLVEADMIVEKPRTARLSRGRAENIYALAQAGFDLLCERKTLPASAKFEDVDGERLSCLEHDLLLNWFRIHLWQIEKILPRLSCEFFSSASVFAPVDERGIPLLRLRVQADDSAGAADGMCFKPDGVFRIKDAEQDKSVLFFLEVDIGTEPLTSSQRDGSDLAQKIVNYQRCILSDQYKVCSKVWQHDFNGFRALFLTCSPERMASVCRLVQEMKPSDFIWVTDEDGMLNHGLADKIWARGGRMLPSPPESILNWDMACSSPLRLIRR